MLHGVVFQQLRKMVTKVNQALLCHVVSGYGAPESVGLFASTNYSLYNEMTQPPEPSARSMTLRTPKASSGHLAPPSKALYQHEPSPDAPIREEWEPGRQPEAVYETLLPPWRAAIRRWLMRGLKEESDWMAAWQVRVRTEGRDRYFYWTSLFGSEFRDTS